MLTWFKNLKTATKLILAFVAGGAVGMGIGLLNVVQVKQQDTFIHSMYENNLVPSIALCSIEEEMLKIRVRTLEMISGVYKDQMPVLMERANNSEAQIDSLIQKYQSGVLPAEEAAILQELIQAWKEFNEVRLQTMKAALAGDLVWARESVKNDMEGKYLKVEEKIKAMVDLQSRKGFELFDKSRKTLSNTTKYTIGIMAAAMFLGLFGGLFISKIIASPLKEMTSCAQKIAAGNLNVAVEGKTRDEVGMLGSAFKEMIQGLSNIVGEIKGGADQLSASSYQIASTSEEAARNNEAAAAAVEATTASMHQMSVNIQNVAKNTRNQSSFVNTTSDSIEQMAASVHRIAFNAQTLVELSFQTKKAVDQGLDSVTQSIKSTDDISHAIIVSAEAVSNLGSKAEEINKIVDVIDDIADQTNLLALNAAIEAARAGEQGLGFAVVAEEVRRLAERSAQSTREIGELVGGVQKEVKEAVRLMEKSINAVGKGVELSRLVDGSLHHIRDSVVEVDRYAKEIGAATKEQAGGTTQIEKAAENLKELTREIIAATQEQTTAADLIVKTMEKLRAMIHENASGTVELASSSEELRAQAEKFQQIVGRFVLEEDKGEGEN